MKVSSRILLCTLAFFLLGSALPTRAQHKLKDEDCLTCHGDSSLTTDVNGKSVPLFVDVKKLKHSIHASMKLACVDCHKDVKSLAHETPPQKVLCADCHAGAKNATRTACMRRSPLPAKQPPTARTATVALTRYSPAETPDLLSITLIFHTPAGAAMDRNS